MDNRQGIGHILSGIGCLDFRKDALTWHPATDECITKPGSFGHRGSRNQDTAADNKVANTALVKQLSSHADAGMGFPVQTCSKDESYIGRCRREPTPIKKVPEANEGSNQQQQAPKRESEAGDTP